MENKLRLIENDLVPVYETSTGEKVVYGTELHQVLGVKSNYRDWINNRLNDCEAVENEDFEAAKILASSGQSKKEHIIKLDIAKEMAMLERNEKGKQVRRYFIQVEKKYKAENKMPQGEELIALAVLEAHKIIEGKDKLIERMKPKEVFADAVTSSNQSILIGELAKLLKQNGVEIGERRLFQWLRNNGYLIRRNGTDYNMPTQRSMELGLFKIKETVVTHKDGHVTVHKTTKVSGKGQQYLINKFLPSQVMEG